MAGYYDGLGAFLDHATEEEFLRPHHRGMLIVESEPVALLDRMKAYQPPQSKRWVRKDDL